MEAWKHHRAIGNAVVGGLIGLFLILLLANIARTSQVVGAIRTTQQSNTSLTRETHSTTQLIRSCVDPDGRCYKQGQKRTAAAVANINRVVILASACAVGQTGTVVQVQTAIQGCVIQRLAAQNAKGSR